MQAARKLIQKIEADDIFTEQIALEERLERIKLSICIDCWLNFQKCFEKIQKVWKKLAT